MIIIVLTEERREEIGGYFWSLILMELMIILKFNFKFYMYFFTR